MVYHVFLRYSDGVLRYKTTLKTLRTALRAYKEKRYGVGATYVIEAQRL